MAILFFLIHFFFVITFFVLGRTIEVIVFSLLAVFSLFFFNSLFVPREREEKQDKKSRSSRSFFVFMTFFKKGVYVFSTALFYLSLYGIAYGLNHIYSHFTLATSF
jgi:hypothetical protein